MVHGAALLFFFLFFFPLLYNFFRFVKSYLLLASVTDTIFAAVHGVAVNGVSPLRNFSAQWLYGHAMVPQLIPNGSTTHSQQRSAVFRSVP